MYVKGSPRQGLIFLVSSSIESIHLKAHCDSKWVGCPNIQRSITSFCAFLGDSLISQKSKKTAGSVLVLSSVRVSSYGHSGEVVWLVALLKDFKIQQSTLVLLFCDSQYILMITLFTMERPNTCIELSCYSWVLNNIIIKIINSK